MPQIRRNTQIFRRDQCARDRIFQRIDVKFERIFEKPPKWFEDPAFQIGIILFFKDFSQRRHTHRHADHFFCVAEKIGSQPIIFAVIGNEHGFAKRTEQIDAIQKIAMIDHAAFSQIFQRHLH